MEAFGNKARFDGMAVLAGCFGRDAAGKRPGRCRWRSHPWLEMDLNPRDPLGCRNEDTNVALISTATACEMMSGGCKTS